MDKDIRDRKEKLRISEDLKKQELDPECTFQPDIRATNQ